ncbi:hypothetical protein I7820_32345, partial [Burkholderia cenocepacia]|nr:hypothetical protein [Burkholderia cenocepacia]
HVHRGHEATLADLQRAARKAKAAEDKLEKAGEKALHARAARVERDADDIADGYAVRRFATGGTWVAGAGDAAAGHASTPPEAAAAFDAAMTEAETDADIATETDASAASASPDDPAPPAAAERRC